MLNIGNKVFRNLPEQVGYNTECIKKLDEALDGLVVEDHLVVIGDPSGTISEEDLDILQGNLAFMYYDGAVYIKTSETLTELTFKKCEVVATEVGGTYYNIGMSKIVVNISTRAYLVSTDNIISVYSKSQLDNIVATLNTAISAKLNSADLLDKTYPVDSIYMSAVNTSPASTFGGTWTELGAHYLPNSKLPVKSLADTHTVEYQPMQFVDNGGNNSKGHIVLVGGLTYDDNEEVSGYNSSRPNNLWADIGGSPTKLVYLWQRVA